MDDGLRVKVSAVRREAASILSYELRAAGTLPRVEAGAHIDLRLGNGLVRSYSLLNPGEEHRYVVAVHLDPASRGGSRYIHDSLREGDELLVSRPRNHFPLHEAEHSVLIAGGIGITPLWAMVQALAGAGRPDRSWKLHYCARTRGQAAFVDALERFPSVAFHFDEGRDFLDLGQVIAGSPQGAHFYCCGPASMLEAFAAASAHLPRERVHTESFSGTGEKAAGGFTVRLAKSGLTVAVPEGSSILDALLEAGLDIAHSCTEGVCGSCETRVLDGIPDHRDLILSEAEKAAGRSMMICCSGAKTGHLVLDL